MCRIQPRPTDHANTASSRNTAALAGCPMASCPAPGTTRDISAAHPPMWTRPSRSARCVPASCGAAAATPRADSVAAGGAAGRATPGPCRRDGVRSDDADTDSAGASGPQCPGLGPRPSRSCQLSAASVAVAAVDRAAGSAFLGVGVLAPVLGVPEGVASCRQPWVRKKRGASSRSVDAGCQSGASRRVTWRSGSNRPSEAKPAISSAEKGPRTSPPE